MMMIEFDKINGKCSHVLDWLFSKPRHKKRVCLHTSQMYNNKVHLYSAFLWQLKALYNRHFNTVSGGKKKGEAITVLCLDSNPAVILKLGHVALACLVCSCFVSVKWPIEQEWGWWKEGVKALTLTCEHV